MYNKWRNTSRQHDGMDAIQRGGVEGESERLRLGLRRLVGTIPFFAVFAARPPTCMLDPPTALPVLHHTPLPLRALLSNK